ncbi:MAG: class I tRNA ligase family protein [Pseudoruegeria sp.]
MSDTLTATRKTIRETHHEKPDSAIRGALDPFKEQDKVNVRIITYPQGSITEYHNHNDIEFWTVVSGSLRIWMDDHQITLDQGESIRVEPLQNHRIESPDTDSIMHATWWTDATYFDAAAQRTLGTHLDTAAPVIVHPPMVTPNGPMHLGHASGPFLQADVTARALRSMGRDVFQLQGCQGHLQYLTINAEKCGGAFYEIANQFSDSVQDSLKRLNVDFDVFINVEQPSDFDQISHRLFDRLTEIGILSEVEHDVQYNKEEDRYFVEALVSGTCPYCHSSGATSECETCGATILDADLIDPIDYRGNKQETRKITRIVMHTEMLRDSIKQYAASTLLPTKARLYLEKWLSRELPDVCVSNPYEEGISVNRKGFEDQKFTDVLERVSRYLLGLERFGKRLYGIDKFEELTASQIPATVALFGSDNAFGRLVIFPALMIKLGLSAAAPRMVLMNEFMLLDGEKFSTSRNHAIWVNDFITTENSDAFRYYAVVHSPIGAQTNFSPQGFADWSKTHWQGLFQDTCDEALAFLQNNADVDHVPAPGAWSRDDLNLYLALKSAQKDLQTHYDLCVLDFTSAAMRVELIVKDLKRYLNTIKKRSDHKYADNSSQHRTEMRMVAALTLTAAVALEPIAPLLARKVLAGFAQKWNMNTWFKTDLLTVELLMKSPS